MPCRHAFGGGACLQPAVQAFDQLLLRLQLPGQRLDRRQADAQRVGAPMQVSSLPRPKASREAGAEGPMWRTPGSEA